MRQSNDRLNRVLDDLEGKRRLARFVSIGMAIVLPLGLIIFWAYLLNG